jgi:hypothetical protein
MLLSNPTDSHTARTEPESLRRSPTSILRIDRHSVPADLSMPDTGADKRSPADIWRDTAKNERVKPSQHTRGSDKRQLIVEILTTAE